MSGSNKSPKSNQHSIKYRQNQHGRAPFEADLSCANYSKNENKQCNSSSELKPPVILSTAQLISTVGQILDSSSRPISFLLRKENFNQGDEEFSMKKFPDGIDVKESKIQSSNNFNYVHINTGAIGCGSLVVQEKLDFPKVTQKMVVPETINGSQDYIHSLYQRFFQLIDGNLDDLKEEEYGNKKISLRSANVYSWMGRNAPKGPKHIVKATNPENTKNSSPLGGCILVDTGTPVLAIESDDCHQDLSVHQGLSIAADANMETGNVSPLCSDYFLQVYPDTKTDDSPCQTLSSSIYADYHINSFATCNSASVQYQHNVDDNEFLETQRRHFSDITNDDSKIQNFKTAPPKPCYSIAKQEHAFSGAFSGVFVSLCLHPVDTIKTVIQSCRAEQRSIFHIGRSIISDRGLLGLYRGIFTNIASSAPISAVYTYSYESVKASLLPCLPKEYYSLAHCVGGGCASIATSFIFTPSERIKQQMQVGSHYRSCWDAFLGIIRNGGFLSLYAGWGAVLCRNIPHSIIKFYTYESLKQWMPSSPPSTQPNTFQTLMCGGLAGSTAAMFTTPFDVIKTRLQTQIPGSINQYDSVFHALYKISKREGLKGLYRGLTPRLIMYMSQGSLFFSSYEFFKRVFSLEASEPTSSHVQKC